MTSAAILTNLAFCAGFALLLWAPLGRWLLRRVAGEDFWDPAPVCVALGIGAWGLLILAAGTAGLLWRSVLIGIALLGFLLLRLDRLLRVRGTRPPSLRPPAAAWPATAAFGVVGGCCVLLALSAALAPEISFDALYVHLPYARDSAATHRIAFIPNNWSAAMPALPLMSFITGFAFSGVALAKLFNALCYALTGLVVYVFARRFWSPLHGSAAAALFLASPVALYESTTALLDLHLTLFCGIAVLALLAWVREGARPFFWLSALSLGFAFGCKYHTVFWVPGIAAVILWHNLRNRRTGWVAAFRDLAGYGLAAGILFLPWLVRAFVYTGNPIFPLANSYFTGLYYTEAMDQAADAMFAMEGIGRSWQALIRLPWAVSFDPGPFRGTIGAVFFPGVLLALVRRKPRFVLYGLAAAGATLYAWALVAQEIRYLLPLAPLAALLSCYGFLGGEDPFRAPGWKSRLAGTAACAVMLLFAAGSHPEIYPKWVKSWTYWHSYQSPFPYLRGLQTAQEYVARDVPSIYVYDYANAHLGQDDRILLLNDAAQFYSRVPTLYSFTAEGEELLLQETEEGVLAKLRESRITHVLLNSNGLAPLPGVAPRRGVYFFLDRNFQARHLEPVYSKNNVVLWRVRQS